MAQRFTVLFADRNGHIREFLQREFEREGYDAQVAGSVKDIAFRILSDEPPDLLVIDPNLPLTDGLALLGQIERRIPSLPVVVYTDYPEVYPQDTMRGALVMLEKTGDLDPLKRVVADVYRKSEERSGGTHSQDRPQNV